MGIASRNRVVDYYSLKSNLPVFSNIIRGAVEYSYSVLNEINDRLTLLPAATRKKRVVS